MSLAGAKLAGLIKMLSSEYPHVSARFIDIDQTCYDNRKLFETIVSREVESQLEETEICYRQGNRFVPHVEAQALADHEQGNSSAELAFPISKEGVYIISGGTNGIGLEIGKYLISRGAQKLVLMGISPLPPKSDWATAVAENTLSPYVKDKLIQLIEIDKEIPNLRIYTGSLEDTESLKHFFDHIRSQVGEIKGVVHSAGVYSDTSTPAFFAKDVEYMRKVFKPKVAGLEVLDDLFKNDRLDFFASFSSLTGLIPRLARGVSDYAMANAFLDFFASYQFHQKGKTFYKTITWVDWNETGGAARASRETQRELEDTLRQEGLFTFSNQEGRQLFERSMMLKSRNWVLLSFLNERAFHKGKEELLFGKPKQSFASTERDQPFEDRIEDQITRWEQQRKTGNKISSSEIKRLLSIEEIIRLNPSLLDRVYDLVFEAADNGKASLAVSTPVDPEFSSKNETAQIIREVLADTLKLSRIDDNESFQNYGLDSIAAMMLSQRLEKVLKKEVPAGLLMDFPTVQKLSDHLMTSN
jgi:acyl carrier protein/NAD(P)-dependent dehydrogenase (short-subunit alcohol dehydrogenase family)